MAEIRGPRYKPDHLGEGRPHSEEAQLVGCEVAKLQYSLFDGWFLLGGTGGDKYCW